MEAEPLVLLLVVPSPLQVNCRVESCPGMVIDLAVEGGLQKAKHRWLYRKSGRG